MENLVYCDIKIKKLIIYTFVYQKREEYKNH